MGSFYSSNASARSFGALIPRPMRPTARDVASFPYEDCWRLFRFRKTDLQALIRHLNLPVNLILKGERSGYCDGEYATLYLI